MLALLTGAIVDPAEPVDRETALSLFVVGICCFGAATLAAAVVGFVVVCCDDDTADVGGVADDNKGGFTVFGMPHIFDSVVLMTLRLGLLLAKTSTKTKGFLSG